MIFGRIICAVGWESLCISQFLDLHYAHLVVAQGEPVETLYVMREPDATVAILLEGFAGLVESGEPAGERPSACLSLKDKESGIAAA